MEIVRKGEKEGEGGRWEGKVEKGIAFSDWGVCCCFPLGLISFILVGDTNMQILVIRLWLDKVRNVNKCMLKL